MAAQNAAASDPILLASWNRNYRADLTIVVVGVIVLTAITALASGPPRPGTTPRPLGPVLRSISSEPLGSC